MAMLKLACLGDFQVTLARSMVTAFQTDKTRALLVYLSMERQEHQRAALAQFFWSGYSDESARNSLRQSIHQLRQLLNDHEATPPWLLLTRQTAQINPTASVNVDVMTFRQLLAECETHPHIEMANCAPCLARLRQAVDLYQGDFLAGFTVADSAPFEEWRRITQEQLHIQAIDALTQLANAAEQNGDDDNALQAAHRQLSLEPWQEAAHRRVMRILAKRGQPVAAITQYQRCCQVLAEELGVEPETETTKLYEQIQSGRPGKEIRKLGDKKKERQEESFLLPIAAVLPHNLSAVLTPLIGRTHSLAEILSLLQTVRLLTLMGPGGMGKTRLAQEVGRQQLAVYPDGVWFVSLAAIATPSAIGAAIANSLGVPTQGGAPVAILSQFLRSKRMLLILDNFEHLLGGSNEGVELVSALLQAAPNLQILVTSRERLNLRGEKIYHLQPLIVTPNATLAEAIAASATRLFVQSAQSVQANFQLTNANLAAVLRICQLVQGMPLGLELAAANVRGAPLTAIADAIAQSAEFLAVEWRDLPERQRSMRAVFAWSWRLLSAAEQRTLRQCAIFRGGFDYAAAQSVIGATLPLLTRLVDKSLLQWQATASGEGRYLLHELLRQFADEELQASGEILAVAEQHGRYYLAYLAARGFRLGRQEPRTAISEIQVELDNIRHAWHWAASQGRLTELEQATYAWWQFCQFQGLEAEGRQSFAVAIEAVRRQASRTVADAAGTLFGQRLLAKLLAIHADTLFAQGRDEEMATQARESIQLGAASGGVEGEIYGTFVLGIVAQELEQYQAAGDLWRQTLQLIRTYQPSHADSELLHDLNWMAYVWLRGDALHFGDAVGGRAYMVQALQLAQALGKRRCELHSLSALARTDFYQGDFASAEPGFRAALDLARTLGYRPVEMGAQSGLGDLARLRGDYQTARTYLEEAVRLAGELALPYDESLNVATLIRLYSQLGDQAAASQHLDQLTQLLAGGKLAKECQLYGYLAAAVKAHYAGARHEALRTAEQAHALNQQGGNILFRLFDTALILGHARAAVGQWAEATSAFQEALAAFHQVDKPALAAEAQAGLAQIALAQNDLAGAMTQIEPLLPVLAEQRYVGYNDPLFIYLTAYRVLAANRDPRANPLLEEGYDLLQQAAAGLEGESRQRFLSGVTIHRELAAAYTEMQAKRTGEKSSGVHALSLSSSHTVTQASSLPVFPTPLVGRAQALTEIGAHLQQSGARLLTLIGPGGMGKTRLAVEAGRGRLAAYADGVWFVPLASIPTSAALAPLIADTLRVIIEGDPRSILLQSLRDKQLLLILDNFEHLLTGGPEAVDLIVDLLNAAPRLQIIVTSRERLKLRGEQLYPVQGLTFANTATLAEASAFAAVRLFVKSVQRFQPAFQLTVANLAAMLRICRLVQGMPLGLELAAANAHGAPLTAIADAIEQSAEILAVDWHDVPERQRSMHAVFSWSWQLLSEAEQRLLRQSAIFLGGFDFAAAQVVTGATLPLLTRLVDKSLLQWQETPAGEGRYTMHELLRQFAHKQLILTEPEKGKATQQRYASYYLQWISRIPANLRSQVIADLQYDLENCRQAWSLAVQARWIELITVGLPGLVILWRKTGRVVEGEAMVSNAIQSLSSVASCETMNANTNQISSVHISSVQISSVLAALTTEHARLLTMQKRDEAALVVAHSAAQLAERINDPLLLVRSLLIIAKITNSIGAQKLEFVSFAQRALEVARQHRLREWEARALLALVDSYHQLEQQISLITNALHIAQELHDLELEIMALSLLSGAFENYGQCARSLPYRQRLLELTQTHNDPLDIAVSLANYANTYSFLGCYSTALTLWQQLLAHCEQYQMEGWEIHSYRALAYVYWTMGDLEQAYTAICTARSRLIDSQLHIQLQDYYYAHILADRGELAQALRVAQRLLVEVRTRSEKHPPYLLCYLSLLAQIHRQSGALAQARIDVEEIVQILTDHPQISMPVVKWELILIYLTCYEVFQQANDPRAKDLLKSGYEQLQSQAAHIEAPDLRHSFLQNIIAHRKLIAAWQAYTSIEVIGVTESSETQKAPLQPLGAFES